MILVCDSRDRLFRPFGADAGICAQKPRDQDCLNRVSPGGAKEFATRLHVWSAAPGPKAAALLSGNHALVLLAQHRPITTFSLHREIPLLGTSLEDRREVAGENVAIARERQRGGRKAAEVRVAVGIPLGN